MSVELGHFALVLALVMAAVQGSLPLIGAARGDLAWIRLARPAAIIQFAAVATAFAALMHAYVVSDFSVLNVFQNSHSAKPLLYRITGTWGNHEGSLLLWALMLTFCGFAVALFGGNLPEAFRARVLGVQGLIGTGFLAFTLFTSNPFLRMSPAPPEGQGLNPLLQDPGLAFHPPLLYLGYVGFSVAFCFAVAALLEGRVDAAWARWVRPWTLAAWCSLTGGIALGSWWAYYELGWGGWWFWDPVENASLLPWLAGTALLHSAIVVEKRDTLKSWTVLLALITFSLSLLGTFLVRSGVLTSVHAFASDPDRGLFILIFLGVVVAGSLALYAWRAPHLQSRGSFTPVSREAALVLNNLLLATATATVLLGTLYPLILDALNGTKISVGPPYFNMTFGTLMVPVLAAMALGPMLPWKRGDLAGALQRLGWAAAAAGAAVLLTLLLRGDGPWLAALGVGLALWVIVGALAEAAERTRLGRAPLAETWRRARHLPRGAWGMTLAHAGMGVTLLGIVGVTAWEQERFSVLHPGEAETLAGYRFVFQGAEPVQGPNYDGLRGRFELWDGKRRLGIMTPETRQYPNPPMETTEAAIRPRPSGDLYAVLGDPAGDGGYSVRLHHKPLVHAIWGGALLMMAGGLMSLSDRRLRVGAPARRRAPAAGAMAAGD